MKKNEVISGLSAKEKSILRRIVKSPMVRRSSLQRSSRLKSGNYYDIIESLSNQGIVTVSEPKTGKRKGRPSNVLSVNPDFGRFFFVFLSRYDCVFSVLDLFGKELATRSFPISSSTTAEEFMDNMKNSFALLKRKTDTTDDDFIGCCFVSGIVISPESRCVTQFFKDDSWSTLNLEKYVYDSLGLKTTFETIANAACNGVYLQKYKNETSSMICLLLSEGIGFSVINDSELLQLRKKTPPTLEHFIINPNGRKCECGNKGCLGKSATIPSIIRNAEALISNGAITSLLEGKARLSMADIEEASEANDIVALSSLNEAAGAVTIAIKNLVSIFETSYVMVSGILQSVSPSFSAMLEQNIRKTIPSVKLFFVDDFVNWCKIGIASKAMLEIIQ